LLLLEGASQGEADCARPAGPPQLPASWARAPVPPARARAGTGPGAGASPWLARQSTGGPGLIAIPELVDAGVTGGA